MKVNGNKLKQFREELNLHRRDIAVAADLSERRIQQLEKGRDTNINKNVLKAIAQRLGKKMEDLAA